MLSFEERKKLHEERLVEQVDLVEKMLPKNEDSDISKKAYKIMLMPQNEKELEFAEARLSTYVELQELTKLAAAGKVKLGPLEENLFAEYYVELLKNAMDDSYVVDVNKYKDMSIEQMAQLMYDGGTFIANGEIMVPYLCKQMGFDSENILHLLQFMAIFVSVKPVVPEPDPKNTIELEMEDTIKLYKIFHKLIEENKISSKEDEDTFNK